MSPPAFDTRLLRLTNFARPSMVLAFAAGLLAVGCGGPALSASANAPFRFYETPRFRLMTDTAPDDARALLEHFERAHSVLGSVAFPYEPRLALQTDVVLLARESSTDFLLENTRGVFLEYAREYFGDPVLYLAGAQAFEEIREVGVHELTHRFVHFHIPSAPRWLDEGLAQYYQTMEFQPDRVTIGKSLLTSFQKNNQGATVRFGMSPEETVPLARLRGMTPEAFYDGEKELHYLSSWAFAHVLQAGPRREAFSRYRDALYRADVDEKTAFERIFGHEPEESLLNEARALLGSELLEVELVSHQFAWSSNSATRERAPSPSEIRCLLARSLLATAGRRTSTSTSAKLSRSIRRILRHICSAAFLRCGVGT